MGGQIEFKPPTVRLNLPVLPFIPVVVVGVLMALFVFIWFFCRIEPSAGQIAVMIRKTGENLRPDQVIAGRKRDLRCKIEYLKAILIE